jgi:hypothetical protein
MHVCPLNPNLGYYHFSAICVPAPRLQHRRVHASASPTASSTAAGSTPVPHRLPPRPLSDPHRTPAPPPRPPQTLRWSSTRPPSGPLQCLIDRFPDRCQVHAAWPFLLHACSFSAPASTTVETLPTLSLLHTVEWGSCLLQIAIPWKQFINIRLNLIEVYPVMH